MLKEKREKLQERIAKLQAREKALAQKDKVKERKERTKRLVELGAIIESKFSKDAVFVLRNLPKDNLAKVEEWLMKHKQNADEAYAEAQRKKAEAKPQKEEKPKQEQEPKQEPPKEQNDIEEFKPSW